ncbi:hypothetical protein GH714_034684 [Hevea brasiliensis]|uniref:Gnk2-homologous domain-containing protein n=1 Tax=Hevea brasiliensis TaxID=3981 RepID=A0A6A6KAI8_HEVBR|nr:hypothetical protein GH714_034684 [Hevea brasiliensis]
MSLSKFISSFNLLLSFALLILQAYTVFGDGPLFHFCSSPENFTSNGPYENNLNKLAGDLYIQTPQSGFGFGSSGQNPDQAYGLALCRGDVSSSDCKTCVAEASGEIRKRCPYNKAAIIDSFNQKTKELLTQLAKEAYATPKLYVSGDSKLGESDKLYGLVQCTRDLSNADCQKCLNGIIGELPSCCDGKEGGRVVSGSCNFRYEIYPFVNA